jgi:hypothetical protein
MCRLRLLVLRFLLLFLLLVRLPLRPHVKLAQFLSLHFFNLQPLAFLPQYTFTFKLSSQFRQ